MGWYTNVEGEMWFCKETWQYRSDVETKIEENKQDIADAKMELAMLVAGSPKDLLATEDCEGDAIDIPMTLRWKLEELWGRIEQASYHNWKLEFLLENWDKRWGDFIDNPLSPHNNESEIAQKNEDPDQLKLDFEAVEPRETTQEAEDVSETNEQPHTLGSLK